MSENSWTVWVGGVEVNDIMLSQRQAEQVAEWYIRSGYDDVIVERYDEGYIDVIGYDVVDEKSIEGYSLLESLIGKEEL